MFQANPLLGLVQEVQKDVVHKDRFKRFQRTYRNDRVAFLYDMFPKFRETMPDYSAEVVGYFDSGETRVAVRGPHGLGKTFLAAVLIHHGVLTTEEDEDCKIPTTASAWRQLEKYLWPEVHKLAKYLDWPAIGRRPYNPSTELFTRSLTIQERLVEAFAVASDDHTTIEGAHATRMIYVFDESKTIPRPTWNAAEGAFTGEGLEGQEVNVFSISTPGPPSGQFYDIHQQKPGYTDWRVRHVTLDEAIRAGRVSALWAEKKKTQWGVESALYKNRVLGEFADISEEGVIPLSWVEAAVERWHVWKASGASLDLSSDRVVGVDVAREGDDQTVFAARYGPVISTMHTISRSPLTVVADELFDFIDNGQTVNIEMDGGYGASVYDMMTQPPKSYGRCRPVTVAAPTWWSDKSRKLKFLNVRSAMWWNLRELLDPEEGIDICLPDDETLIEDITAQRMEETSIGKMRIVDKKKIKKHLGRSPDKGDAVALAFWETQSGGGAVI